MFMMDEICSYGVQVDAVGGGLGEFGLVGLVRW